MIKFLAMIYRYSSSTMLLKHSMLEMQLPDQDKGTWLYTCMHIYYTKYTCYLCLNFSKNLIGQNSKE